MKKQDWEEECLDGASWTQDGEKLRIKIRELLFREQKENMNECRTKKKFLWHKYWSYNHDWFYQSSEFRTCGVCGVREMKIVCEGSRVIIQMWVKTDQVFRPQT